MYITIDSVNTAKKVDYNKNENWIKFHVGEIEGSCTIIVDDWGSRFDNTTGRSKYIYINSNDEERDLIYDIDDFGYTHNREYVLNYWGHPLPVSLYVCFPHVVPDEQAFQNIDYGYFEYDSSNETWSFEWNEALAM